jgi:hypothetical protein
LLLPVSFAASFKVKLWLFSMVFSIGSHYWCKIHEDYIFDFVFDDGHIKNIYLLDKKNIVRNKVRVINILSKPVRQRIATI